MSTVKKYAKNKIKLRAFFTARRAKIFRTLAQNILSFYIESSQKEQCERAREQIERKPINTDCYVNYLFPINSARDEYNHM